MVFGRQIGNSAGQRVKNAASGDRRAYSVRRHNAENFKKLWHAARQEIGIT